MSKRINIPTNGADRFVVSGTNPNPHGECLCSPDGRHTDCHGPFMVFTHSEMRPVGGKAPLPVLSVGCAKSAVLKVERGGEIAQVGAASIEDENFDGGEPDDAPGEQALKAQYEQLQTRVGLSELPSWDEYKAEHGLVGGKRPLATTGIDPNAKSLVEARAATAPVHSQKRLVAGYVGEPGARAYEGTPDEDRTPVPTEG